MGRRVRKVGRGRPALWLLAAGLCASLGACTVGPDYEQPTSAVPDRFGAKAPGQTDVAFTDGSPDRAWWDTLGDPLLSELVAKAAAGNQKIAAAKARVREARALYRVEDAETDPKIDAVAGGRLTHAGRNVPNSSSVTSDTARGLVAGGFDARWELDIFGGGRRRSEAASAAYGASVESARDVLLTVVAEVARNYFVLRGTQRRVAMIEQTMLFQQKALDRVRSKFAARLALEYDVVTAETPLQINRAALPAYRADIQVAAHRIAVLTGENPTALLDRLLASKPMPVAPDVVPVGLPSDLLKRRPDVREAERTLQAATAKIGVATADLFPRLSLTGSVSLRAASFTDLFQAGGGVWGLASMLVLPLFNRDRLEAQVAAAGAHADAALADYRQTVLTALEEVESDLVRYGQEQVRRRELQTAVEHSERAYRLSLDLYEKGLKDVVNVVVAQRTYSDNLNSLITSETAAMTDLVALYKALGGGWSSFDLMQDPARPSVPPS